MNRTAPLSLLLALPLAAQDTHDLRLTAVAGTEVWLDHQMVQSQLIDMGGQEMETGNTMRITFRVGVTEATDTGSAVVEATIERVRGKFSIPMMGEHEFDSIDLPDAAGDEGEEAEADDLGGFAMPDFDRIGRAAGGMKGTKLVARLDAYGKVLSIDGVEAALGRLEKRAGKAGSQMLTPHFSERALKNLVEAAFGERPRQPTAVGGTWERDRDDAENRRTENRMTMTLAKVDAASFMVSANGTITKPAAPPQAAGEEETEEEAMVREMQAQMKIENGKIAGRAIVSREDGFVVEARTEMSMDMKMPGPLGGEMAVTQRAEITTQRTTRQAAMAREDGSDK